jgi:L-ascorbate metabolism protein UlaG (beta-lactamase superfamily)
MEIKFHGHSCFELSDGDTRVLIDPFLAPNNPVATASAGDVDPTHVLISHGHADHMADAVGVAKASGSECVAVVEIAKWLEEQGVEKVHDPNLGGTVSFDWGWVKLVPAWHTSTTPKGTVNTPAGLIVRFAGKTIYHLGDTCLFSDLALNAKQAGEIDLALICIGGHYTMDRHDAAEAARMIGAKQTIPCHYDTFPPIETDVQAFKVDVEARCSTEVIVLAPGDTHSP